MNISHDILENELWKFMSIDTILNYCSTNKKFSKICKDQNTWKFLLERDFNIINHIGDQKKEYMRLYALRKYESFDLVDLIIYYEENFNDKGLYIKYLEALRNNDNKALTTIRNSIVTLLSKNKVTIYDMEEWIDQKEQEFKDI